MTKGFNFSKFKKVKETKDYADLVHEDGHKLTIAKGPLSHTQRKQLEHLEMHSGKKEAHYAEGTPEVSADDEDSSSGSEGLVAEPIEVASNSQPQAPSPASIPAQAQTPQTSEPVAGATQAQIPGLQEEKAAELEKAQAIGEQGQKEAQAFNDTQNEINKLPSQQDVIQANKAKSDNLAQAYADSKIDPKAAWQNAVTPTAIIGTLISGLGQAIGVGQVNNNAALDLINKHVDQEIQAQAANQGKQLNLYKMNREALGNDLAANLATREQLYTGLKYQLLKAASESKSPIAMAEAHQKAAIIDQQIGQTNFKLSLLNPTSDNPDPASRIQFLVPEQRQQKVVDEINAAKNTVNNAPGILEAFDHASKEVRPFTGGSHTSLTSVVPGLKSPGQQALQARLGPTFQDVEGTVRQAAMDNMDHNITPKFGDNDETIATKRKSLIDYLRSKSAAGASKSFGLDLSKFPSTNTLAIGNKMPEQNMTAQSAPQYQRQVINGKVYMVPVQPPTTAQASR